jgi:hypothetical protein
MWALIGPWWPVLELTQSPTHVPEGSLALAAPGSAAVKQATTTAGRMRFNMACNVGRQEKTTHRCRSAGHRDGLQSETWPVAQAGDFAVSLPRMRVIPALVAFSPD